MDAQTLLPRDVPLGGQRAIHVRRTLPHRSLRMIGAFCFVDHYGSSDPTAVPVRPMRVPPHPHMGLQTVSWLLDGAIDHRDSVGSVSRVRPGELNLMTSGAGIAHSEYTAADGGLSGPLHGVQLWIALPDRARQQVPHFEQHRGLPVAIDGALQARVIVGSWMSTASAAATYSDVVCAEISLSSAAGTVPLEPRFEYGLLPLDGDVVIDSTTVPRGALRYLPPGSTSVMIEAAAPTRFLMIGGEPFDEDLVMWWNFVGRSHDEIAQARAAWESGRRFGKVVGDPNPPLPAPAMPHVRLRPRPPRAR